MALNKTSLKKWLLSIKERKQLSELEKIIDVKLKNEFRDSASQYIQVDFEYVIPTDVATVLAQRYRDAGWVVKINEDDIPQEHTYIRFE